MADEQQAGAGEDALTGFEGYSTEVLEKIRANLAGGLDRVAAHHTAGTLDDRPKRGAATPREAGYTILMMSDQIEKVLRQRGDHE